MTQTDTKKILVVLVTCPNEDAANAVADHLVSTQTAACVNIVPRITSVYTWKGQICRDTELLLVIKCRANEFHRVKAAVLSKHPYEVPEIIGLPVTQGHEDYINWVYEVTTTP